MFDTFKDLNLQLFDGAAAAPSGGEASGAKPQGAAAPATGENTQAAAVTDQSTKTQVKTYTEDEVQTILKGRLEKARSQESMLAKLGPIVEIVGAKYGMDASDLAKADLDALHKKLTDDDSLYEAEAERRGMSVEATKQVVQLERENAAFKRQQEETARETMRRQYNANLAAEAVEAKKYFPNLDLVKELKNPKFAKLVAPGVNIDVKTAYEIVHKDEIQPAMMAHVVKQTAQQMSNAIQSGSMRPSENGAANGQVANVSNDPRTWTKEYKSSLRERVRRGEKVVL